MAENFPNLGKETDIQAQEAQRVPNEMNTKISTPLYSVVKMAKVKELILKEARKKRVAYKGNPLRASADFSSSNL